MKVTKEQRQESIDILKGLLKRGDTIYNIVTHVAQSGMSRCIRTYVITPRSTAKGRSRRHVSPRYISIHIARIFSCYTFVRDKESIRVNGCGFDACEEIAYKLSYILFNDGYKLHSQVL